MMKKYLGIGELKVSLDYENGPYEVLLDKTLGPFVIGPVETPDIRFWLDTTSPFPVLDSHVTIFTTIPKGVWTILEDQGKSHYIITFVSDEGQKPSKIVKCDKKFSNLFIYSQPNENNIFSPIAYPLDELVISSHLNINKIGIILHSACISLGGAGYLFAGVSGAGKSTISEIWKTEKEAEVLTDERTIIREYQGDFWAFGTPWHGTSGIHKNAGAHIDKIFFIKHGKENRATPLSKTDAANRFMVRCFPTFWNREGMEFALGFCARLAQEKECYELEFINDVSVAGYLKGLHNGIPLPPVKKIMQ